MRVRNITTVQLTAVFSFVLMCLGLVALGAVVEYNAQEDWAELGLAVEGEVVMWLGILTTIAMFFCACAVGVWISDAREERARQRAEAIRRGEQERLEAAPTTVEEDLARQRIEANDPNYREAEKIAWDDLKQAMKEAKIRTEGEGQ